MGRDAVRSQGDAARDVEEGRVRDDGSSDRRLAASFDRLLSAAFEDEPVERLVDTLLSIVAGAVKADVAVLRLREGDLWRTGATLGLEEDAAAEFSLSAKDEAEEAGVESGLHLISPASVKGERLRKVGVHAVYRLPLIHKDVVGDIHLGMSDGRDLSDGDKHVLDVVSTRAAAVLVNRRTHESLCHAVLSRDQVLSVVAHDLRNPLSVISMSANTLLKRLSDSSARRSIDRIIRGSQRADRLVRDLLEVNAIESGTFSIEKRPVEPADLILAALESQQSLAADASVIIGSDLSPDLLAIDADEERLLEVLENLIGNAAKFTPAGGSITVGASQQEGEILIWVQDSGSGIAVDQLPHIFDRFWQAKKAERRGTGLGLTICKGIVEAHGGRIWAESELGAGAKLCFTVPSVEARASQDEVVEVTNILLVDDRPENLLSLKAILERPEYRLVTATSGQEALGHALREVFAVALIDVAMPGMNGLEVATAMKELERSRDTSIIFVTAFGNDPEEIHRAYSAGGADYLVKPLDIEIVRKKVAVFVDLSRRRRGIERPRGGWSVRT